MITVHNLTSKGVAKPLTSSIVYDKPVANGEKVAPNGPEGWKAFNKGSAVTWTSPATTSEPVTEAAGRLQPATMDNINRARYVDIAIGTGADDLARVVAKTGATSLLSASKFGNWRHKSTNGFCDVSERVYLQKDGASSIVASYDISYSTGSLKDVVMNNPIAKQVTKMSDMVNNLAATASSLSAMTGIGTGVTKGLGAAAITGERMSRFNNYPTLQAGSTKTGGGFTELSFEFNFGQAGIFSGEEEVVKPIIALVTPFALKAGVGHSVYGPFPSETTAKRQAMLTTLGILAGGKGSGMSLSMSAKDFEGNNGFLAKAVGGFNSITDKVYAAIDTIAGDLMSRTTTLTVVVGGLVSGPYIVKSVSWSFDFNNVDEYGYPCHGIIKYGGLEPIRLMVASDYTRQWGYTTAEGDKMTPLEKALAIENGEEAKGFMAQATEGSEAQDTGTD